jgi:hypothetical protein
MLHNLISTFVNSIFSLSFKNYFYNDFIDFKRKMVYTLKGDLNEQN